MSWKKMGGRNGDDRPSESLFERGRIQVLSDERNAIQKKTFTKWMNLALHQESIHITDLYTDLRDGTVLLKLMEVVSGERMPRPTKGHMRIHMLENVDKTLRFLEDKRVYLACIGAHDIVDGNSRLILGLVWTIILRFVIEGVEIDTSDEVLSARDFLLAWCQKTTNEYCNVNINNFTTSWKDGLAFNAIIHKHRPDLIQYDKLSEDTAIYNLNNAFNIAEEKLGIIKLFEATDVFKENPDDKPITMYVVAYYQYFSKMKAKSAKGITVAKAAISAENTTNKSGTMVEKETTDLIDAADTTEHDNVIDEYEKLTSNLLQWIEQNICTFSEKRFVNSLTGLRQQLTDFNAYCKTEKPLRCDEKGTLEELILSLEKQMTANNQKPYTPNEGKMISDVNEAWQRLEEVEREWEHAIRKEMINLIAKHAPTETDGNKGNQAIAPIETDGNNGNQAISPKSQSESWMKEKTSLEVSVDYGEDKPSPQLLLQRHGRLESEVKAYEGDIQHLNEQAQKLMQTGVSSLSIAEEEPVLKPPEDECVQETILVPQEVEVEQIVEKEVFKDAIEERLVPQVRASFPYSGERMKMDKGEVMILLNKTNNDWWNVRNTRNEDGFVPANYVKEIEPKIVWRHVKRLVKVPETQKVKKTVMKKEVARTKKDSSPIERSRIQVLPDERDETQKKAFMNWINSVLHQESIHITDLYTDLRDGTVLLKLLEVVCGERMPHPTKGHMRIHMLENVDKVLRVLKDKRIHLECVGAHDIVNGNPQLILGLVWTIILRFGIEGVEIDISEGASPSARDFLLAWCQKTTSEYCDVKINNFTTSWKDGLAFNAIIHKHRPDLIQYDKLSKDSAIYNLNNAFNIAEEKLGIVKLFESEDVFKENPDDKSITIYVVAYYNYFSKMKAETAEGITVAKAAISAENTTDTSGTVVETDITDLIDALDTTDHANIIYEYEKLTSNLLQWVEQNICTFSERWFANSLFGLRQQLADFNTYCKTEKPLRCNEKGTLEELILTLQKQMTASNQKPYTPNEGNTISDVNKAWQRLEKIEREWEHALREELINLILIPALVETDGNSSNLAISSKSQMSKSMNSLPIEEPQKNVSQPEEQSFQVNTSVHIQVSRSIGKDWKDLGRLMGLTNSELESIEVDSIAYGMKEMAHKTIDHWVRRKAENATEKALVEYLKELGRNDVVQIILAIASSRKPENQH